MRIQILICTGGLAALLACNQQRPAGVPSEAPNAQAAAAAPASNAPEVTGPLVKCELEKLSRAERAALDDVNTTALFAMLCGGARSLSFEDFYSQGCSQELPMGGGSLNVAPLRGQMKDPRENPNYEFAFTMGPHRASAAFHPKHAGTAGLYSDGINVYCNAAGKASPRPELLLGSGAEISQKLHPSKKKR